jgi:hypothetical protein
MMPTMMADPPQNPMRLGSSPGGVVVIAPDFTTAEDKTHRLFCLSGRVNNPPRPSVMEKAGNFAD